MKPRIDVLTLAVESIEESLEFCGRIGFASPGIIGTEFVGDEATPGGAVAMFELDRRLRRHEARVRPAALHSALKPSSVPRHLARTGSSPTRRTTLRKTATTMIASSA